MSIVDPAIVFAVFRESKKQSEITKNENMQQARTTLAENPVMAPYPHKRVMAKIKVSHFLFFRNRSFRMKRISW